MNVNRISCDYSVPASPYPCIVRLPCSGSSNTPTRLSGVPNPVHVRPTSWYPQVPALLLVFLVVLVESFATVSAAPLTLKSGLGIVTHGVHRRQNSGSQGSGGNTQDSGSVSMTIWLPILLVAVVFVVFSVVACLRRRAASNAIVTTISGTTANRTTTTPGSSSTTWARRRPRRTPSQISTKSLPPYMKEPGDLELVLFRGPSETEDDQALPLAIPTLVDEEDEHPEMRNAMFDIALDRIESVDTTADSSTANLIRRASESVARPPEVHHATMHHDHRPSVDAHSVDSIGSDSELLPVQPGASVDDHVDPRGEAPAYTESASATMIVSLNDPEPTNVSSNVVVPPSNAANKRHSRFSFLRHNPFSSHDNTSGAPSNIDQPPSSMRSGSPALHVQNGSALSRFSSRESHETHYSRAPSRNNLSRSHSRSNSSLLRAFHAHSSGPHAGSSTISLDSISAPLKHTLTRAEFHAPKGGLLTPEQIKLITSKEGLERFRTPYGPDAVAAFSLSRDKLAETVPPPNFESVVGEHQEQPGASGSGASGDVTEVVAQRLDTDLEAAPALSLSLSLSSQPSSDRLDVRADSDASTAISYTAAPGPEEGRSSEAQTAQAYTSEDESEIDELDEPHTARQMSPRTARPLSLSRSQEPVAGHH